MTDDEVAALREEFEAFRESLTDDRDAYRENVIQPALDEVREECDDATTTVAEQAAELQQLRERVRNLEQQLDNIVGVDDPSESDAVSRVRDLRAALIRRARARSGKNAGRIQVHHEDVGDILADLGHGEWSKPTRYKAMRQAARGIDTQDFTEESPPPGFSYEDDAGTLNGRDTDVLRLDLAALPDGAAQRVTTDASSDATTGISGTGGVAAATDGGEPPEER